MTAHTEADPTPEQPWTETSSPGMRRMALQACEAAVRKAKEAREGKRSATCRRCGDSTPAGCEDWDCHLGWGEEP